MDWIMNREPFFPTREEAEEYMKRELPPAAPAGWKVERSSGERLSWTITRILQPGERGPWQNYRVEISRGLDFILFFYGNSDAGCLGLHQLMEHVLAMETRVLRGYGLGECLKRLFAEYQPNRLGLT